ncbi:competence type IV pilus minor pilin ComGG [Terrilactibacillus sp. S3-3]|nr:competence type IV pilus minor pilin ComGG [Terrilactibacillus sp. S3-3]
MLNSDRHFFQTYMTAFQFQQLRECAVADISDLAGKKTLPTSGTFIYDLGKAEYETSSSGQVVTVWLTLTLNGETESDQFDYDMNKGGIIKWIEKT